MAKSGYLSKSGKRNPKYNRYWFRLQGEVLSYYRDSTNLYFPHGQIDLRFGISASVVDREKDGVHFEVVTSYRTYNFKADSAPSAKEWVKSLQRVIFRSHNEGDSVKISLPIHNIIDVEETQMMEFTDTCKIRVIDNDETYAIDEVRFTAPSGTERQSLIIIAVLFLLLLIWARGHQRSENPDRGCIFGQPNRRQSRCPAAEHNPFGQAVSERLQECEPGESPHPHYAAPGAGQGNALPHVASFRQRQPACQLGRVST